MPKWFDMGKEGVRLCFVTDEKARRSVLVLLGVEKGSLEWNKCLADPNLKFKPSPTGKAVLVRPFSASDIFKLAAVQRVFPHARQIEIAHSEDVRLRLDGGAKLSPQEMALTAALRIAIALGTNAMGQRVFETTSDTRFVIDENGDRTNEDLLPAALCLRGNDQNLAVCAQGFVLGLMGGAHAEASDVARFVDILYGAGASGDQDLVEKVSQMIESGMTTRLIERHLIAGDGAYREAQALYENAPPHMGVRKGAGAVPLPVAVAVQELVRAFGGEEQSNIYIPRLFDGSLAAMLGQTYVTLTDPVDPESREAQMRTLIPLSVNVIERGQSEAVAPHRISILNVENVSEDTLAKLRGDVNRRLSNGMSILLAPEFNAEATRVEDKERATKFIQEIQKDYAVLGLGVVSGVMRKKLGLTSGLTAVVVGHRYSNKEKSLRGSDWVSQQVVTMFDWDALRAFTNTTLVSVHEAAGRKMTAAEEASLRANETIENSYQLPYQSFSTNGEVELMIPRNLAGSTYKALQTLQDRVGDLDAYVKNAIGFDDIQYDYLAPEQVDAAALMVAAIDRGKGFMLGDQTGAGKGATIATAVSYAWERGLPVVFVTKQDNLFSDFYRDLKKTGLHEKMRPMILNHTAQIVDQFSDTLEKIASGIGRKAFLQNFRFGLSGFDNPNIIFATYSQFSSGQDSEKSDWIKSVAPGALVIFDESHLAAGDTSQLGQVCTDISDSAKAVVYSSATWLKDSRQMRFYQRMLPASVDAQMVSDAMKTGGESLQEVFTAMLAEDGLFIRRERDSSQIEINRVTDEARLTSNEAIANEVSLVLQGLQRLCGVTDQVGRRLTKGQVEKLDAAKNFIQAALGRAAGEVTTARQAIAAERAAEQEAAQEVEQEAVRSELAYEEQAQQVDGIVGNATVAQHGIDHQEQMIAMASAENEDFIAAGEGSAVFDAALMASANPEQDDAGESVADVALRNLNDLRFEDLGMSEAMTIQVAADLQNVSGDADAQKRLEREIKRIQRLISAVSTRTTSFGSMLFLTQRTLNISLQARFAAERAIQKIREGKKPIIFLEQTFERRLEEQLESPDTNKNDDGTITIKPITLKDNLREMYTSIVNISHVNAEGERFSGTIMDSRFMASEEERGVILDGLSTLQDMIDGLPDDLYCSPIDTMCHAIRQAGFSVGEATGRKYHVVDITEDGWKVALRTKKQSKISEIERAFNFGEYDALVGNKAMSTGISLHASKEFPDQRQRSMLFTQVFSDINDYIQAIGRADRRGQIMAPEVEMLASGLPSEARVMMNHHDKLRKLLASTTSNRSSRFEEQELPDLFNSVGDISVRDFLQANPGVATRLGIDFCSFMPGFIKASGGEVEVQTRGLSKFSVARLDLLPVAESRSVYQEISHNFAEVIHELDAQGINPLRTNIIDLTNEVSAEIAKREDLLPALLNERGDVSSVFDEAVELHTIAIERKVVARTWEQTLFEIETNSINMFRESLRMREKGLQPDFVMDPTATAIHHSYDLHGQMTSALKIMPSGLRERTAKMFDAMQVMMRSSTSARSAAGEITPVNNEFDVTNPNGIRGLTDSMGNVPIKPAQVVERRKNWLMQNLQYFMPGQYVSISFNNYGWGDYKSYKGVVIGIQIPPRGRETNLSRWSIMVQHPGYSEPARYTLHDLYKARFHGKNMWLPGLENIEDGLFNTEVAAEFNDFIEVTRKEHRYVLSGNLFRAASIAAEKKIGAGGVLQMRDATPTRIISIRKGMDKSDIYESVPVEISRDESVSLFCSTWEALDVPPSKSATYWSDFFKKSLDNRGIHSHKDARQANLSVYWLPTKVGYMERFIEADEDGVEQEAGEQEVVGEIVAQEKHLIAGIGVRYKKSAYAADVMDRFVAGVNTELGYNAVAIMRGRTASDTVRCIVRFKDVGGARDASEMIRLKLAAVVRQAATVFEPQKYFTHSTEMRLLALAVSTKNREQARQMRDAAEEARQMRAQMNRMSFGDNPDNIDDEAEPDDIMPQVA